MGQIDASYMDMLGCDSKTSPMAIGADGSTAIPAQHHAELNLIALLLEVGEKGMQSLEPGSAVPHKLSLGVRELIPWRVNGQVGLVGIQA